MDGQDFEWIPVQPGLNGYLEESIVVDWQTPIVFEKARALTAGPERVDERLRALFSFVRDEIAHSFDIETDELIAMPARRSAPATVSATRSAICSRR